MNTCVLIAWTPTGLGGIVPTAIAGILPFHILAVGDEVVGGKNLVSHGPNTQGQNECYGSYTNTTQTGWGPSYQNSCIHSDSNEHSGGNTVWYNYALASAGTITDENTTQENPANNTNTATESICPKSWTLPTSKQINTNRDVNSFSPVLGGAYGNGTLNNEDANGIWWGSEAYDTGLRRRLDYGNDKLTTNSGARYRGFYIRCVSEEKTATDLTYMQDMTPTAVAFLLRL